MKTSVVDADPATLGGVASVLEDAARLMSSYANAVRAALVMQEDGTDADPIEIAEKITSRNYAQVGREPHRVFVAAVALAMKLEPEGVERRLKAFAAPSSR